MTLDMTKYAPALKQYYSNTRVENMVYRDHPFMAMLAKDENFYGKNLPLPIIIGTPQRRSASFAIAKANGSSSTLRDFLLLRKKDYSLASIDNETAEASENDKGAFLKALTVETDGAFQAASISMASSLFRDGSGAIGQIATGGITGAVVTLADVEEIVNFEIGMTVQFAAAKSTGALRSTGSTLEIIAVDRDLGKITFSANVSTLADVVALDFLFAEGDRNEKLSGLDAWLPYVAPTLGDSFFGIDRSVDPVRLAGVRIDGTAMPVEEAFIKGGARVNREGGNPDIALCSYNRWEQLNKALGSKVQYNVTQAYGRADIGFQGIAVKTNKGIMNVVADPFCPDDKGYLLTSKSWKLYSLKKAIRILDLDGNKMLRDGNSDSVELRIGGYSQLGCNAPGHNGVIQF
jgi:hypothetical protein